MDAATHSVAATQVEATTDRSSSNLDRPVHRLISTCWPECPRKVLDNCETAIIAVKPQVALNVCADLADSAGPPRLPLAIIHASSPTVK